MIPYDEQAMECAFNDINMFKKECMLSTALDIFEDFKFFFPKKIIPTVDKKEICNILKKMEILFVEAEEFEKCAQIVEWQNQLK